MSPFEFPVRSASDRSGSVDRHSAKILVRLNNQDLDVPTAFSKSPEKVRGALLEAIRHVAIGELDISLLLLERAFKSALQRPTSVTAEEMMSALEIIRLDDPKIISSTFYAYGGTYGIAIFVLATSANSGLLALLEQLPREDQILLVRRLTEDAPRDLSKFLTKCTESKSMLLFQRQNHS